MKIGFMELVVIFIVALLAIGPDKLPAYAQKLGQALREFRKVSADVTQDVRESVIEPLEEAQQPLREALEPLEALDKQVRGDMKDLEKEFHNIGKPKPVEKGSAPAEADSAGESEAPDALPDPEADSAEAPEAPAAENTENTEQTEGEDL